MSELVSIVVPVYNMSDSIESCVKSLQAQDYSPIEILLVDDGSDDDSYRKCQSIAENDSRVRVFHTENRGSGPARNYGIEQASGKYIYFPDADDYLEANLISTCVKAMKQGKYDLVVFGYRNVNQNNKLLKVRSYIEYSVTGENARKNYAPYMTTMSEWSIQGAPWNKFFNLEVIKKYNIRYPSLRRHQDEGFISRYMCYAQNVHFISDVLYTYYVNTLQKEWKKYPLDYINAVTGLYQERKETILTWNAEDYETHDLIEKEYICNVIKALELTFSPKNNFKKKSERIDWLQGLIEKSSIKSYEMPTRFNMKYQKKILSLIKSNKINCLYYMLDIKTKLEKNMKGVINNLRGK